MKPLSEFILESLENRTSHIDLSSPCDLTRRKARKREGRNGLLQILELTDDIGDWGNRGICLCHHCEHDSGNGWCGNPLHLHIGTWKENWEMRPPEMKAKSARLGANARAKCSYESVKETMRGTVATIDENGNSVRIPVEEAKRRGLKMTTSRSCRITDTVTGETTDFPAQTKCAEFLGIGGGGLSTAISKKKLIHGRFRVERT